MINVKHKPPRRLLAEVGISCFPLVFYILIYRYLPEIIVTHYGMHGADGFSHKDAPGEWLTVCLGFVGIVFGEGMTLLLKKFPKTATVNGTDFESALLIVKVVGAFMTVLLSVLGFGFLLTPVMHAAPSAGRILRTADTLSAIPLITVGGLLPEASPNTLAGVQISVPIQKRIVRCRVRRFAACVLMAGGAVSLLIGLFPFVPDRAAILVQNVLYLTMAILIVIYAVTRKKPENG